MGKKAGRNLSLQSQKATDDEEVEDFGLCGNKIDLLKPVSDAASIGENFLNKFNQEVVRQLSISDNSKVGCANVCKLLHLLSILLGMTDDEISDFLKPARDELQ